MDGANTAPARYLSLCRIFYRSSPLVQRALYPNLLPSLVVFLCTDGANNINGWDFIVGAGEISLVSLPAKERSVFSEELWTQDQLENVFLQILGAAL